MPIKSQTSLILGQIESEHPELLALEFGKIAISDYVYTLASTNIEKINTKLGQNVCDYKTPNEFNYGSELSELSALEFEKFPYLTLFTL